MLNKLQKLREEREQGFTLIELLVVILIIGILAAIAIPAFLNQRKSAVDASVESDVTNAAKVVETEAIKGKGMPLAISGDTSMGEPLMVGSENITEQVKKGKDADLKLEGTTNGYIITGTNDGGTDDGAKAGIVYDSANGGLAKAGATKPGGGETVTGGVLTASHHIKTRGVLSVNIDKASGAVTGNFKPDDTGAGDVGEVLMVWGYFTTTTGERINFDLVSETSTNGRDVWSWWSGEQTNYKNIASMTITGG